MEALLRITASLAWLGVGFLIFLLWRIARFYERSSGRKAYSFLFPVSLLLMAAGTIEYLVAAPGFVGRPTADFWLFLGGGTLTLATLLLKRIMMGRP